MLYKKILSLYNRACIISLHRSKNINDHYKRAIEYISKLFDNKIIMQEFINEEEVKVDEEKYIKTNLNVSKGIFSEYRKIATMICTIEKDNGINSYIKILRNSTVIYSRTITDGSEVNIEYDDFEILYSDSDDNIVEYFDVYSVLY